MGITPKNKPHIFYMHPGSWPVHIGFTSNKVEFGKEMSRLGVTDPPEFITSGANATTHILTKNEEGTTIIVCLDIGKKASRAQILGLICHEACHVWTMVCESMRGSCPGGEHQAYGVQWIAQNIAEKVWGEA